ncbi:MAG: hypothetical protein LE169_05985 [Endomicrobium sp.]|nr:hypothetical protein [Endomicrobium sp.]
MKRLIVVSLIAILVSGCNKSAIPQLSVPLSEPKPIPLLETQPLYSMTPLDSDSDEDIRNRFFNSVIRVTGVCAFVLNLGRSVSLLDFVVAVYLQTGFALWVTSFVYVYLFPNDTSYKDSYWCKCVTQAKFTIAKFTMRAYLAAMLVN